MHPCINTPWKEESKLKIEKFRRHALSKLTWDKVIWGSSWKKQNSICTNCKWYNSRTSFYWLIDWLIQFFDVFTYLFIYDLFIYWFIDLLICVCFLLTSVVLLKSNSTGTERASFIVNFQNKKITLRGIWRWNPSLSISIEKS